MIENAIQNAPPREAGFLDRKQLLAPSAPSQISLPKAEQLVLALQTSPKVPKRKQVRPLRKRRRAEKIAPSCSL
jgi:hypothetical protein